MRVLHDFIHKLADMQTHFRNGGIEHIIEHIGLKPSPESFYDINCGLYAGEIIVTIDNFTDVVEGLAKSEFEQLINKGKKTTCRHAAIFMCTMTLEGG